MKLIDESSPYMDVKDIMEFRIETWPMIPLKELSHPFEYCSKSFSAVVLFHQILIVRVMIISK